jgi:hypothetical protein
MLVLPISRRRGAVLGANFWFTAHQCLLLDLVQLVMMIPWTRRHACS